MTEAVDGGGATLAWRLLATLEGGSLVLAAMALLAYTRRGEEKRPVRSIILSNATNRLGKELKRQLELRGCIVSSLSDVATSGAGAEAERVDAAVVVGAESTSSDLNGLGDLVTEDVYNNLKLLDTLSNRVHRGGYILWACAGKISGAFSGAANAFDAALKASLQHAAKSSYCEPIWIGRCETAELAAERVVSTLMSHTSHQVHRFSIRNAAYKVSGYIGRCLKIVT